MAHLGAKKKVQRQPADHSGGKPARSRGQGVHLFLGHAFEAIDLLLQLVQLLVRERFGLRLRLGFEEGDAGVDEADERRAGLALQRGGEGLVAGRPVGGEGRQALPTLRGPPNSLGVDAQRPSGRRKPKHTHTHTHTHTSTCKNNLTNQLLPFHFL